jgi:hypothetical protein
MRYLIAALLLTLPILAQARDDGRYANNPLKPWFDQLKSKKGFCCSDADGKTTEFEMRTDHYWVPVNGEWVQVPEEAVITEPNKVGHAMLWLTYDQRIRCFLPGGAV